MKYLVLYHSTVSAREQMERTTAEQKSAGMDVWMKWAAAAKSAITDMGGPLADGVSLSSEGKPSTSGSTITGYSLLQAESREDLMKALDKHPHFMAPGASIEVLEVIPMT